MSYDRQIDQICPHEVFAEALYVGPERQLVRPARPIAAAASVQVRMNGLLDVPSAGVETPGQVVSRRSGPYAITASTNSLVYRVGNDPPQALTLPISQHLTPTYLCDLVNPLLRGVVFQPVGSQVCLRTIGTGPSAVVFVGAASTLATYLGIATSHEYRGQQVAPGWTLVTDLRTLADRPTRLIQFDQPLRSVGTFVEVSYSTLRQECRRCGGTGVEHDWRYGSTGEVGQVRDEALLVQEIQKLFYTARGSNPFHVWYGTGLLDAIGKKLTAGRVMQSMIVSDIYAAFNRWQSIKKQQELNVGQYLSDEEYPFRLLSVDLQQSTKDPTVVFVNIAIQNRSRKPIQLTRGLKLPAPVDLLGSTQQQGLIRQSLQNYVLTE